MLLETILQIARSGNKMFTLNNLNKTKYKKFWCCIVKFLPNLCMINRKPTKRSISGIYTISPHSICLLIGVLPVVHYNLKLSGTIYI